MSKFTADFFMLIVVIVFPPLLVRGMPSLTQNEGIYKNEDDNNDELVAEEEQQQLRGSNLEQLIASSGDSDEEDVGYFEATRQMKVATNRKQQHTKKASSKREGSSSRRKISNFHDSQRGRPADIVLLVDTGPSMRDVCVETKRLHEITQKWALKYHRRGNRIAIAQFDYNHGKILLNMGKWRLSSLKRAIDRIKCPGAYGPDVTYNDFTSAMNPAKKVFTNLPQRRGIERLVIVITYGSGIEGFDEAKILREQLDVHIKAVLIATNVENGKVVFRDNLQRVERVKGIVADPNNDVAFENVGNCRHDRDCAKGIKCFLPRNLLFWNNLGFCGCLLSASTFDTKKYSLKDCCRHVPLPTYARPEHYYDECY